MEGGFSTLLRVIEGVVLERGQWVRVRRGKGRDGRGSIVHFEGGGTSEGFVRGRVVGEADALSESGPTKIVGRGEEFHRSIPVSPPAFNLSITLCVVSTGRGACRSGGVQQGSHEFGQELRGGIGVDDVWSAAAEKDLVKHTRCEGVGFAVREGEDENGFGEAIDDS